MITHLKPDILECEVKWALGSITINKASGGDGIPVELFQILKDDDLKVLHSICQQIWKIQQWPQDWKRSVFIPIPKKGNAKECSSYHTIALVSHASKVMLKILQARLQQYVNSEIPDVQAEFRKGRGTRDQIASVHWIIEKAREFQKNILVQSLSCVQLFAAPWTAARQAYLSITNSRVYSNSCPLSQWCHSKHLILYRPLLLLPSIFPSIRVFSNESAFHIKWAKEYVKAVYCHPAYLTYMQSTSC